MSDFFTPRSILWRAVGRPLFRCTFHNWYGVRQMILSWFGAKLGRHTKFRRTVDIDRPWNVAAGTLAMIGDHAVFRARRQITLGDRAVVSQLAVLSTEMRGVMRPGHPIAAAPITLEDDTWIAADTLVLPGVAVRQGTVVGARSMVEGELPPWTVAAGEPALAKRPRELRTTADNLR